MTDDIMFVHSLYCGIEFTSRKIKQAFNLFKPVHAWLRCENHALFPRMNVKPDIPLVHLHERDDYMVPRHLGERLWVMYKFVRNSGD
jgi:hypothetical protein